MEENLLKYFTGNGEPTTEDIKPINVKNGIIDGGNVIFSFVTTTNDNTYFIKYGGYPTDRDVDTTNIEVYNVDSIKTNEPLYSFKNLKINGHNFLIVDMHQDEDGRFYALGYFYDNDLQTGNNYLIIFNNFIQDGEIHIRKYYTNTTMGFSLAFSQTGKIIKGNNGDYFLIYADTLVNKIYHYKIDINSGNTLETANIQNNYSGTNNRFTHIYLVNDTIIFPISSLHENKICCIKLIIDINNFKDGETYSFKKINELNYNSSINISVGKEKNFKYYIPYLKSNGTNYNIAVDIVDLEGNLSTIEYTGETYNNNTGLNVGFEGNYIFITNGSTLKCLYNNNGTLIEVFTQNDFTYTFTNCQTLKQFNIDTIFSVNLSGLASSSTSYVKNINSVGYSSIPYYNNNFMIPQYLNLYSASNDNTSLVFSRDVSNRFVAGNQLTAMFNIPNYLLNNETIHREIVNGQTNLAIENDTTPYSKNRFESLYMTYMYNMYIKDNTNGDNLINMEGSNRLADSVWKTLDYQQSPCLKARITYDDETQETITLTAPTIEDTTATYTYQVEGKIVKIEYLSNDTNTVYATYRCNLTGTNTITQTITIEEG